MMVNELEPKKLRLLLDRQIIQVKRVLSLFGRIEGRAVFCVDVGPFDVLEQSELEFKFYVVDNLDRILSIKFHVAALLGK